jgi:hypothetical protein
MPKPIKRARKRSPSTRDRAAAAVLRRPGATAKLAAPSRGAVNAIQRLFDGIPDDELRAALQSTDDERCSKLLEIMDDTAYAEHSMALRIRAAGLTVGETLKSITSMYHSDAGLRVARRIPAIMERMAVECEPHRVPCPKCSVDGGEWDIGEAVLDKLTGKKAVCARCRGKRTVQVPADNDVRKMILENQHLLGDKAPLIDARSIHVHGAPDMTDWSRGSDESIEKLPRRRVEGTVIDVEEKEA